MGGAHGRHDVAAGRHGAGPSRLGRRAGRQAARQAPGEQSWHVDYTGRYKVVQRYLVIDAYVHRRHPGFVPRPLVSLSLRPWHYLVATQLFEGQPCTWRPGGACGVRLLPWRLHPNACRLRALQGRGGHAPLAVRGSPGGEEGGEGVTLRLLFKRGGKEDRSKEVLVRSPLALPPPITGPLAPARRGCIWGPRAAAAEWWEGAVSSLLARVPGALLGACGAGGAAAGGGRGTRTGGGQAAGAGCQQVSGGRGERSGEAERLSAWSGWEELVCAEASS
jgi:hypothetical protein